MRVADLVAAYEAGQTHFRSFSKNVSQTTGAGIWFDLSMSPGNPVPQYYFATPLTAIALARSTDGGLDHGPNPPAGYRKYLSRFLLQNAIAAPVAVEILDYLMYYPGIGMDEGPIALTTNISLPRQTAGREGRSVQVMAIEQNPYASAPAAQFFLTYTNQDGVAGQVTPTVTCNAQLVAGTLATSALATAGCAGRFVPLARGDSGVRSIQSIEFVVGDVGLLCLVLVKPIARASIFEIQSPCEINYLQDFGFLPVVPNDAYLNMIVKPQGTLAAAPFTGDLTTVWSNA